MPITFNEIPAVYRVPGNYTEISNNLANTLDAPKNVLLIAQMLGSGIATELQPYTINNSTQAKELFGVGSELAIMAEAFKRYNTDQTLVAIAVPNGVGASAATGTFTFSGTATATGVITLYIAGSPIYVQVPSGSTANAMASSAALAINSVVNLPCEATASGAVVTVDALNVGLPSNNISLAVNALGEPLLAGADVAITAMAGGAVNPNLSAIWPVLGETLYNWFITPFKDTANLTSMTEELNSRYTAMRQIGGRAFYAISGTFSDVQTFGLSGNCPQITVMDVGDSLTQEYVWATINAAHVCKSLAADPSAPVANTQLMGVFTPPTARTASEQNQLLFSGVSPYKIAGGNTFVVRQITMYKQNALGEPDNSYIDIEIPETLDAMRNYRRGDAAVKFKGYKLSKTNESFTPGSKVMSVVMWKAYLLDLYQRVFMQNFAWVQDYENYKATLQIVIDTNDKNRINFIDQPTLIGQFLISAGITEFK